MLNSPLRQRNVRGGQTEEEGMNPNEGSNEKGMTLIELLVGLVISAIIVAGVYRVFVAQTRAYTVQEQVVEVQQNIRAAMELMLRDIRMAGYKSNINPVTLATSIFPGDNSLAVKTDAIRVEYQRAGNVNTVVYFINATDASNLKLTRQLYINGALNVEDVVLEEVNTLNFTYGVDGTVGIETSQDGAMDDRNGDGTFDDNDWVSAATVNGGSLNIIAIRVALTAAPSNPGDNPDIKNIVPRNLVSTVNLRNLCLVKSN
jgi:prepilin-type N-terminal cleavage/methylation domain-containing protein